MNKAFENFLWENYPSINTALDKENLNKVNRGINEVDNRVISLDTTKLDKADAQGLIKNITFDLQTGVLTKYYYNGSKEEINTGISKLNMNLRFNKESQILYIVNADGTEDPVDLSVFITNYEFKDSDTIAHNVSSDGTVTSIVKEGSIEEKHLQPNYLADIKVEVAKAQSSATAAATSETNAKSSENAAKASQAAAEQSESDAAASATNSENSATLAGQNAAEAASSAAAAKTSEENAEAASSAAAESESNAQNSADASAASATRATSSASTATEKATEAENYAGLSQSYTKGTGGEVRENDDSDCAEYYYNQMKKISQSFSGVVPMGTITFEDLSNPDNQQPGYMFNISDSFVSDERFQDGGGIFYGSGNNVLYTADGNWDVLAASVVSGVKGNNETEYRQGFVNITPENVGALPADGNAVSATKATQDGNGNVIAETYAKKPEAVEELVPASWEGTEAPYSIAVPVGGVTDSNTVIISPGLSVTKIQYDAIANAQIMGTGQADGTVTLKAFGEKPEITVPIQFTIQN